MPSVSPDSTTIDAATIHPISGIRITACASATSGSTHAELVPATSTRVPSGVNATMASCSSQAMSPPTTTTPPIRRKGRA